MEPTSYLYSPLARLPCLVREARPVSRSNCSANRNGFTIASVISLTYPTYISACLVQRSHFTFDRFNTRNMWTPVGPLIIFSLCSPTRSMSIEQVPTDLDIMVEYVSGALCGCAGAVSEDPKRYRERRTRVIMRVDPFPSARGPCTPHRVVVLV